ncbi:MIP18 family protein [Penicillium herquei]|nr:MIP18 family protein [Penicillium herquei]
MENSNPTILNAADLPTRNRPTVKSGDYPSGIFAAVPNPADFLSSDSEDDDLLEEPIDEQEIYGQSQIQNILSLWESWPSFPFQISSSSLHCPMFQIPPLQTVTVLITPTITHCSLATVIGLGVRVRLEQSLPPRFRLDVRIKEGTHSTGDEVNKQLADKERVAAALENGALMQVIAKMMETCQ